MFRCGKLRRAKWSWVRKQCFEAMSPRPISKQTASSVCDMLCRISNVPYQEIGISLFSPRKTVSVCLGLGVMEHKRCVCLTNPDTAHLTSSATWLAHDSISFTRNKIGFGQAVLCAKARLDLSVSTPKQNRFSDSHLFGLFSRHCFPCRNFFTSFVFRVFILPGFYRIQK